MSYANITDPEFCLEFRESQESQALVPAFHFTTSIFVSFFRNPGRFGPGSFRPESFRPGSFRPILGVGRFGLGRWVVSANFLGESIRP